MQYFRKLWHGKYKLSLRILVGVILLCLTLRSVPYLIPIRAQDIAQTDGALTFEDRHGLPLGTLLTRDQDHTMVVPLDEMSPYFIQAIIAAEDKRYYQHGSVDFIAVSRAILEALQAREIVSGASTITMQLARMLHPTPRTLPHKVGEIWTSWRLSAGMDKDTVLAAYINRLPMGSNLYGVEAAARSYFGLPAAELNLAQATLLASLPNDPIDLDPYHHWQALKTRQRYVLDRMVADKMITELDAERAYSEQVYLRSRQQGILAAPHFLFWVAQQLPSTQGGTIRTTLDSSLQQFVATQVQQVVDALAPQQVHHAAALVIDNHTGEVLAYVGSPNYFNDSQQGQNDGVQALRQPGSTLKPFLYQLALEQQLIRPQTILADVPTTYAIPGAKLYKPVDYSETFLGPVRVRLALANSLNVPAVRVLEEVGVPVFLNHLRELGFTHLTHEPEYYGLGLTLGSGEVSLWELARAYLRLAHHGKAVPLVTYFGEETEAGETPTETTSWELVREMLGDRHARATSFGVDSVLNLPFPAAVKTGTSSDYRDTWTVGFSTDYTVATWVGNFDGTAMQQVSGVMGAAPLWHRIMQQLHESREPADFAPPSGLVQHPICAVTGQIIGDNLSQFQPDVGAGSPAILLRDENVNKPAPICPSAIVLEYLYPQDIQKSHSQNQPLELPPEYNEWLSQQPQNQWQGNLRIVFPANDDYFLLAPQAEQDNRLEFKLAGKLEEPVEWWLNGDKIATTTTNSLFWQMKLGSWELEVKTAGGEERDRIIFQVQEAPQKRTRRGFSIAD
ncbi:penicillin-binding protein 1C [Roseofilum capinflatum]|uniref:Penicillin-binding protein 1C n=1 Tax=Roseofilum capinflatum BLCC-M114 TaxID=3022440 RepID=A0ABT7B3U1_9CYAN|nr:penicillin-binding protein 1C [Roseofilum capinflatum]MDJ1173786.1 penicillin-binding protein 1C [Roseofilum capinflatum BLCC-M114]